LNWQNLYAQARYMVHNNACGKYINMEIVKWSLLLIGKLYSSVLWCTSFFLKSKRTTEKGSRRKSSFDRYCVKLLCTWWFIGKLTNSFSHACQGLSYFWINIKEFYEDCFVKR
jgi:hypothetical protein